MKRTHDMRVKTANCFTIASPAIKPLLCLLTGLAVVGIGVAAQQKPSVVRVDTGLLQGMVDDGVVAYKGVPFAAPPVGNLRWRPPQPAARWTGVREATQFGAD